MWTTVLTHFVAAEGLNTGSSLSDPLLVGWGHKVLFPIRCEGDNILEDGQKLPMIWGPAVAKHVPGFGEGATVRLIIRDYSEGEGVDVVSSRLASLSCQSGSCGNNYVVIDQSKSFDPGEAGAADELLAAVSPASLSSQVKVDNPRSLAQGVAPDCNELYQRPPLPANTSPRCGTWNLFQGSDLFIQLLQVQSDNRTIGLSDFAYARGLKKTGAIWKAQKEWAPVGKVCPACEPEAVLLEPGHSARILWRGEQGVKGPANTTVMMSALADDGTLILGKAFAAGGQNSERCR